MSVSRRDLLAGLGSTATVCILPGTAMAIAGLERIEGRAFGTDWQLALPASPATRRMAAKVSELLERMEECLSPFRPRSEISLFNANESLRPQPVSRPFAELVAHSLAVAEQTAGAFDPTLGPAVARYGFGPIRKAAWNGAGSRRDYRGLRLREGRLSRDTPDLTFDPCGAGKGYALDIVARYLRGQGLETFLFVFGGDVIAASEPGAPLPWRIGIENPRSSEQPPYKLISLRSGALATSGDSINGYAFAGKRYCHIIDPRTAAPVDAGLASVSVISRSGVMADALATALMAMGPERGLAFAGARGLPSLFLLESGDGLTSNMAGGFERYIVAKG